MPTPTLTLRPAIAGVAMAPAAIVAAMRQFFRFMTCLLWLACPFDARRGGKLTPIRNSLYLGISDVVPLADLQAIVAQDAVGSGEVEIEIGPGEAEQVLHALERQVVAADLEHDVLLLAAVDLGGLRGGDERERLGDPRLEFVEGLFGVLVLG